MKEKLAAVILGAAQGGIVYYYTLDVFAALIITNIGAAVPAFWVLLKEGETVGNS